MVLTEDKNLYQVFWWGEDHYPCSRLVGAGEAEEARDIVLKDIAERGQTARNLCAVKIHNIDGYEVKLIEKVCVETKYDSRGGYKMPYCPCGNGLCFDDEFCGRCGNRLDWEQFWE